MGIKVINFRKLKFIDEGAYGEYFRIRGTKNGVKIQCGVDQYSSKRILLQSYDWSTALREFRKLQKIAKITDLVPRPREMVIVKQMNGKTPRYCCGYVMEHIFGNTLNDYDTIPLYIRRKLNIAREQLREQGIEQFDSHGGNVMVSNMKKRKIIFIDADGFDLYNEEEDDDN
jgi:hypothetical protein